MTNNAVPKSRLIEFAQPVRREVTIDPTGVYRTIGCHLYGKGVYERETKTGVEIKASRMFLIEKDDLVINRIWAQKGSAGIVPQSLAGAVVTPDFPVWTLNPAKAFPPYIGWYLKTSDFWEECRRHSHGTSGRERLSPKELPNVMFPLPPLGEQRRVVARIEELAALIEEAQGLRVKAREEAAAFVTSLHLKLAQERIVGLDEILELDECREAVQPGRKYPQIGIKGFGQGLFAKEELDATQTSYKAFNHLYEGAVVLSQPKGWEGAIAVCPAELAGRYASPEYRTFRRISDKAIPEYLAAVFATPWFWTRLKNLSRGIGARRQRTRPEQFLAMEVPMPTADQQKQAISIFRDLHELTALQDATQPELDALLPSVLDQAFRGEL